MLALEPILLCMAFYISVVFGNSLTQVGHLSSVAGWSIRSNTRLAPDQQKGRAQETHIVLIKPGAFCLPFGIIWLAWTSSPTECPNAWPQILAGVPVSSCIRLINMQDLIYIVDCYGVNVNSAVAGITFMRSLFASGLSVFGKSMNTYLGVSCAMILFALCAVLLAPVPVLFYYFASSIRAKSNWGPT
ncbi:hypothetical protein Q7P35_008219 [Cladosporium inversicolor]